MSAPPEQEAPAQIAARLAHDVGKHIARAAQNITNPAPPRPLIDMLASDLYELEAGRSALEVFRSRGAALIEASADARLGEVERLLIEAGPIEVALRAGEPDAVVRGTEIARSVSELLRAIARDMGEPR